MLRVYMASKWTSDLSTQAKKQRNKLSFSGKKPSLLDTIEFLLYDLEENGPYLKSWPNYSVISEKKMRNIIIATCKKVVQHMSLAGKSLLRKLK